MGVGAQVSRVVAFLRAGCPPLAPATGYAPLLALLPRRVADDEVMAIVRKLVAPQCHPVDSADVGVEIIRVTGEVPSTYDIDRVLVAMESAGHRAS
ncbi:DUF3349 domain-containing protein [Mycobacterium intracellulare]|uniref:DUF3349 domain-containing protein n=1 Tax=Mycobacterium intracellulare TaxID=1767 RepID=UPI00200FE7B4|nr:DUF3349 domain-containing protein [Mycobacterium intracellulare]UQB91371.1 DUF3349 domain-containing protein [Mycobacterium intracellulare]